MAEPVEPLDADPSRSVVPSAALGAVAIVLDAEVDIASGRDLLALEVTADARAAVLLDASGVTFMDVAGLRAVLLLRAQLRRAGHEVHLVRPSPVVLRLLGWVRLGPDLEPVGSDAT